MQRNNQAMFAETDKSIMLKPAGWSVFADGIAGNTRGQNIVATAVPVKILQSSSAMGRK